MPRSILDICNQAIALVGATRIAALDDGSAEGEQCAAHYETVVGSALTVPGGSPMRWRFATTQAVLARLADPPAGRWQYAYQLPPDMLRLHAVTQNRWPVVHDTYGDKLFTDEGADLVADYTYRASEAHWPADFAGAVVQELAIRLALALNRDADLAKLLSSGLDWRGVRTADSQARSSPRLWATRLTGARFGGSSSRWR